MSSDKYPSEDEMRPAEREAYQRDRDAIVAALKEQRAVSGIKEGLHAAPLTQGEWNQLFHGDEWERHPTHHITLLEVARIRATIDNGGFAAAEPTDEEINASIARGLGWDVPTEWKGFGDLEGISRRHDCFTTDLHFALEALRDLPISLGDVNILGTDCGIDVEWGIGVERTGQRNLTPEQAARRLALLLFERITNAGTEDEVERARRFT